MGYQIHTPCLPETSFCDGSAGCGNDTEMVAIARIMPIFTGKPWDEETAYGALEVVEEPDGTMYITKVPTPAGTPLTECKFWAVYNKNMWTHLEQEITDRKEADDALGERIDSEEAQRIAADAALQTAIEKEEAARVADVAKLTQELADEVADRAEADSALGERLDNEITARKNADTELEQILTAELDNVKGELDEKINAIPNVNNIAPVNVIDAPTASDDYSSFAAGAKASAGENSTAVGINAKGIGYNNVAIGRGAVAETHVESIPDAKGAVSIGNLATAYNDGSVAIGAGASVAPSATNGVAIGNGATVHSSEGMDVNGNPKDGANSVAIGYGSSVSSRNHFNVGSSKQQRIIGWVADPVAPTDAATKRYVDSELDIRTLTPVITEGTGSLESDTVDFTPLLDVFRNLPSNYRFANGCVNVLQFSTLTSTLTGSRVLPITQISIDGENVTMRVGLDFDISSDGNMYYTDNNGERNMSGVNKYYSVMQFREVEE